MAIIAANGAKSTERMACTDATIMRAKRKVRQGISILIGNVGGVLYLKVKRGQNCQPTMTRGVEFGRCEHISQRVVFGAHSEFRSPPQIVIKFVANFPLQTKKFQFVGWIPLFWLHQSSARVGVGRRWHRPQTNG